MERKVHHQRNIGPYKRHELLTGQIFYPAADYSGYGDGINPNLEDFISAEMRRDWGANREALLKFWFSGQFTTIDVFPDSEPWLFVRGFPGTLPWAAQQFDEEDELTDA